MMPRETRNVLIRRGDAGDLEAVAALAAANPGAALWPRDLYLPYCQPEISSAAARALFVAWLPPVAAAAGAIVGMAAYSAVVAAGWADCELENMVVAADWRRRGIGLRLLRNGLLWCAAQHGRALWLEVRASNCAARIFYEKEGFQMRGVRQAYYAQPVEDAVCMEKALDG